MINIVYITQLKLLQSFNKKSIDRLKQYSFIYTLNYTEFWDTSKTI